MDINKKYINVDFHYLYKNGFFPIHIEIGKIKMYFNLYEAWNILLHEIYKLNIIMKFRILEYKGYLLIPIFIPQYKTFLCWNNVSNHTFAGTIMCHGKFINNGKFNKKDAEDCLKEFKQYLKECEVYTVVHKEKND